MSSNTDNPGLISGHAQYVKGAAVSAAGSVTGSESWQQSGEQQKDQGVQEMKAASEGRDPQSQGFGKVEEVAGKVAGCEGMEQEGAASKQE
ncbi:MAG: hypothetical protein M1821_005475 [Bathelium mastoideum]|nr:MAG: hypothetical protein M1821_005475 [Bathelium mastoideum]KAI9691804.1 MAG: hypothetical protein M1822_007876 [Bathelium mastoideum]